MGEIFFHELINLLLEEVSDGFCDLMVVVLGSTSFSTISIFHDYIIYSRK